MQLIKKFTKFDIIAPFLGISCCIFAVEIQSVGQTSSENPTSTNTLI